MHTADGVKLDWTERGSGRTVLCVPYWSMHPSIYDPLAATMASDWRVVRYDARGTGASDRTGPHDIDTCANDLELICETVGGVDAAVCLVESANYAARVAARRPDLLRSVVCMGSAPFGFDALGTSDSLIGSRMVVGAFLQQLEADYRGAIRAAMAAADAELTEEELKERVSLQVEYADGTAMTGRARAWADDTEAELVAQGLGERLAVVLTETMGGGESWFPAAKELEHIVRDRFPEAAVHWTSDGIVSAPEEVAEAIGSIVAAQREYDRQA